MSAPRNAGLTFLCNITVQIAMFLAYFESVASQTPLPLPANPAVDCGLEVTRQWSKDYPQCMQSILGNSLIYNEPLIDPDQGCCMGSQKYFGSESTLPSRNCFCDPDVYARFMLGATAVDVVTAFGICYNKGFPIPVYDAGGGACSGAEYNTTSFLTTNVYEPEPLERAKNLHAWLSDLHTDGMVLTSFVFALISAIGFCGYLWMFLFNAIKSLTVRSLLLKAHKT
ncbi:hypothetical protein ABBQ32_007750 [Trebouxia sp. C0010 RCD-2024]